MKALLNTSGHRHGMLPSCLLVLAALLSAPLARAATPSLMPDERATIQLQPKERNPFAQAAAPERTITTAQESASEDARLRRILGALKIAGTSRADGKSRVLLGSLIVSVGEILPPIIGNQVEVLRVVSVDDSKLTLAFVERDSSADPRKIELPINMKPVVSQFLYGEAVESLLGITRDAAPKLPALDTPAVKEVIKVSQDLDLQNVAERNTKLMGGVRDAETPAP
jgi:hypothetical protein